MERTADFADAFKPARGSRQPAIIHVKIDPEAITPATTLSKIREQAMAGAAGVRARTPSTPLDWNSACRLGRAGSRTTKFMPILLKTLM
ncbi:MAG TPA: hypothetical protein VGI22_17070 [Xanthobacteraceae bacterium]